MKLKINWGYVFLGLLAVIILLMLVCSCAAPQYAYMKSISVSSGRVIGGQPVSVSTTYSTYYTEKPSEWHE